MNTMASGAPINAAVNMELLPPKVFSTQVRGSHWLIIPAINMPNNKKGADSVKSNTKFENKIHLNYSRSKFEMIEQNSALS